MHSVSIRELSGDLIARAAARGETLGITNNGALAGVLVPLDQNNLQRLVGHDMTDTISSIRQAEAEMVTGLAVADLSEFADETPGDGQRGRQFSRVSIRDLSGTRLEKAAQSGEALVVTSDRVAIALLIPVTARWVERLVEDSLARFLSGDADLPVGERAAGPDTLLRSLDAGQERAALTGGRPILSATSGNLGRNFLQQRVIGIRIIADAPDGRERVVGVVTDMLARVVGGPLELPLANLDESHVFAQLLTLVDNLTSYIRPDEQLSGVGVEIGGHVRQGRVVYSANARWDHFPIADLLSDSLGVPVVLENDANALAVYERWFYGIDDDRFAVVLLTHLGVGCGLVLDGHVYRGSHGMAGEIGHVSVDTNETEPVRCRCLNVGCLEGVSTPRAIQFALKEIRFDGGYEAALKAATDEPVKKVFTGAGAGLGRGISTLINLFNPSTIVFYGPAELIGPAREFHVESETRLTGAPQAYMTAMVESLRRHAFSTGADDCQFRVRNLSDEQGAKAAAACLIRRILVRSQSQDLVRSKELPSKVRI